MTIPKQQMQVYEDLAKHAAQTEADRVTEIAALSGERRAACMIAIKASKQLLEAFMKCAIEEAAMPREAADFTAAAVFSHLKHIIDEHFDKAEETAQ